MATKKTQTALAFIGVLLLSGFDACDNDILQAPGFDLWCGDELCSWVVEEGEVERVASHAPVFFGNGNADPAIFRHCRVGLDRRLALCVAFHRVLWRANTA